MRTQRQRELLERMIAHRAVRNSTDLMAEPVRCPVSEYVDPEWARQEFEVWFRQRPLLVGPASLMGPTPGWRCVDLAGVPIVLTKDSEGAVRAFFNVCRHRGAPVAEGTGGGAMVCNYHGWTYQLNGQLASRRRATFFDGIPEEGLVEVPCVEEAGLLFVTPSVGVPIAEPVLGEAAHELAPFALGSYHEFARRRFDRAFNWKLAVDTFAEAYHVGILHSATLDPMIFSDYALFDAFGDNGRMIACRRTIDSYDVNAQEPNPLLAHATILYFLVPNTVLIYQQDHMQLYQAWPGPTPDTTTLDVSLWIAEAPPNDRVAQHWQRNFDLLVDVTDGEDFAMVAKVHQGFRSGAQEHIVFGRNEPALAHYHDRLSDAVKVANASR